MSQQYEPMSELWRFKEYFWGETANYSMGRYEAGCTDYDGDYASFFVKRDGEEVARGTVRDFDDAIRAVETVRVEQRRLAVPEGRSRSELMLLVDLAAINDVATLGEGAAA